MSALIVSKSPRNAVDTIAALRALLETKQIQVFAVIDHSGGARNAGLALADEFVVLFGNPGVGTLVMQDRPESGYDLPLRMLVWDDGGTTRVGYRDPAEFVDRYGLDASRATVKRLSSLMRSLADELGS